MTHITDGKRIYAIGDIHGCLDQLCEVQNNIHKDLAARPHAHPVIVYLGDYTDRGPDTRGVIENLMAEDVAPHHTHLLFGNHDEMLLTYRKSPAVMIRPNGPRVNKLHWLDELLGGMETMRSYGVDASEYVDRNDLHAAFLKAVPDAHVQFLESLELHVQIGSYLFVHAGIDPDVSLSKQTLDDFIWMREPFLSSSKDHGFTVVHGHSPSKTVDNRGNRIGVDTGAVFGGELSCLVLEDSTQMTLGSDGVTDCPVVG